MDILRPNGDVTVSLSCSTGSSHYALVDETSLDVADYVYLASSSANVTGSDLLALGTFTKPTTLIGVTAWFNIGKTIGANGGAVTINIKLYKGATEIASASDVGTGWRSLAYTGDLTQAEIDDLRVYVYVSATAGFLSDGKGGGTYYPSSGYCYMAYAVVEYPYLATTSAANTASYAPSITIPDTTVVFPGESFPITFTSPFGDPPFVATAAMLVPAIGITVAYGDVFVDAVVAAASAQGYEATITGTCFITASLLEATAEIPTIVVSGAVEIIIPWKGTDFPGTFPIPLVTTNASFWHIQDPTLFIEVFLTVVPMTATAMIPSPAVLLAVGILSKINGIDVASISKHKGIDPATIYKINNCAWL